MQRLQTKHWKLHPVHLRKPKLADVLKKIEEEIQTYGESFRHADGIVRDSDAIWTILCLKLALKLLPRKGVDD